MNIAFRVDASAQIGTGHFMRCLTLAQNLHFRGVAIRFVSRLLPEYLCDMLSERGYECILLDGASSDSLTDDLSHSHWLACSQQRDAQDCEQALADRTWEWLIVDHYALDARWESALRKRAKHIFVIDDIADRQHDCDILLDQNFYADMGGRYSGKVPPHCRLLLGPQYALLRDEFRRQRVDVKVRIGPVKRVLVFFGGIDAENYTGRAIDVLSHTKRNGLLVDVVIGIQHPFREQIESSCSEHKFTCYVQTGSISELMAKADLAIGAGGSATWERCCLGLPTIAIATAANQLTQVGDAAGEGLLYSPEIDKDFVGLVQRHLGALIENSNLRNLISQRAMGAVDGLGVFRIARKMGCTGIQMRLASQDDSVELFKWRNHEIIRAVSRNPEEINWSDHQKWYAAVLSSSDRVLLIGEQQTVPVGVVRFDFEGNKAEVSIYLVPGLQFSGRGQELLQCAEDWLENFKPEIREIKAVVLGDNDRSHHLFLSTDYQIDSTAYSKRFYDHA
ncbi:UDP-2,4-diacetamido-2,4,6-trideoxy-beta-L-altropyranose hydrolase [Chlorobium phaeovibrioides]|uniref:UDP-2,4-diacetamido-2,4, 6-trideoxy-beta-L-altropyranose hydrolase n=1 Tax=Chlorobium phaeovibrioides TaxID=1094 RepID=UPI000F81EC6A|nr:UDP-2,4-diacetamido-2,4,6-trideoxy-beta-L-altropyranose hydrolase [Chlorobium phaeovibrioides]RTY34217.1 UDP-2,4-diacetamido-2,4,6-trideoxy-beta-L-altropyranose hydrolase [Chlorobium phaeovibrioides]